MKFAEELEFNGCFTDFLLSLRVKKINHEEDKKYYYVEQVRSDGTTAYLAGFTKDTFPPYSFNYYGKDGKLRKVLSIRDALFLIGAECLDNQLGNQNQLSGKTWKQPDLNKKHESLYL